MSVVAATLPVAVSAPAAAEASTAFNHTDLDRLRSLLQQTASQTANPGQTLPTSEVIAEAATAPRSFGDSILDGIMRFRGEYQKSVESINTRVSQLSENETAGLNNFSEILSLQVDVSKWSMSVMGVDNASKAGTNTIKELSRG
jgi:hypothetical protein